MLPLMVLPAFFASLHMPSMSFFRSFVLIPPALLSKNISFVIRLREKMYFELQTNEGKKTSLKSFRKHVERYGIYAIPMNLGNTTYTAFL